MSKLDEELRNLTPSEFGREVDRKAKLAAAGINGWNTKQSSDATGEPYNEEVRVKAAAEEYDRSRSWLGPMDVIHEPNVLCNEADNSGIAAGAALGPGFYDTSCAGFSPQQRMLNKQAIIANLQRQLQVKAAEVEKLHRAITILTLHPEFDMFLELSHLLDGIKL